jgi:uncharacterized membrane protein YvlD (DUF360 family)
MTEPGSALEWHPGRPRLRPLRLVLSWALSALALLLAAAIVPGATINGPLGALLVAAIVAVLNAVLPPVVASLRLPFTVLTGFLLVLVLDGVFIRLAAEIAPGAISVGGFGDAFLVALVASAASTAFAVVAGVNDDEEYALTIARRIARRTGQVERTDKPGVLFLEIDGLALPVLRRAIRDGNAPTMARWVAEGSHALAEWETDLSSQTGASQAGILLGSNDDIPAFRWVEKETGRLMTCSNPGDCAEIERRHLADHGLLADGGTSRGNLLSGGADAALLTASRIDAEKRANPGYRAFLANGSNVTRTFVLFFWEVALEVVASARQRRRDVLPRGHRGGRYPFLRAGLCVFIRDLVVYSVLQDMARGVPAVYATFASYDEVAHHSGLERQDTLEALRKLDARFAMIERARRFAPRPYEIVVLSDHGQTQGATFKQRNGYGLDDLVERSLSSGSVSGMEAGDEHTGEVGQAFDEATARKKPRKPPSNGDLAGREVVVLGSGNLGLVYLMDSTDRLSLEEIDRRHPELLSALREHPHVGVLMVRSDVHGPVALGAGGMQRLRDGYIDGRDPLAAFPPNARRHLLRTDGFAHAPDILVNSFYDAAIDEGCAFEELISFHGGMGGPQTQPFLLHPVHLELPREPLVGAEAINELLRGWRSAAQRSPRALEPSPSSRPAALPTEMRPDAAARPARGAPRDGS